jgi:DNA repair exonuclease SbcCD ATPase subunit
MSISDMDLDFDNGIILISGPNHSGKSSIFDAIALCFTSKKRSTTYSDYVKQGKEFANIVLDCEVNGEPVHFDVRLNLVKGTAFQIDLTYKGETKHNTDTEEIIESFGLGYYSDIMFNLQSDEYKDITQLSPAQRAYYLQKLLNFDFDEQKIKLKKDIDQFNEILKQNNTEIPLKQNYLEKEQASIEEIKIISETEESIKKANDQIIKKQAKIKNAEDKAGELADLNKKILELTNNINDYNNKYDSKSDDIKTVNKYKEQNKQLQEENEKLTAEQAILLEQKTEYVAKLEADKILQREVSAEIRELEQTTSELLPLRNEIDRLEKLYDNDQCPYCGQDTKDAAEEQYLEYIKENAKGLLTKISSIMECKEEIYQKISDFGKEYDSKMSESIEIENRIFETEDFLKKAHNLYAKDKEKISFNLQLINGRSFPEKAIDDYTKELLEIDQIRKDWIAQKSKVQEKINQFQVVKISDIQKEIDLLRNKVYSYTTAVQTNLDIEKRNKTRNENIAAIQKEIEDLTTRNAEIIKQRDTYDEAHKIFDKDLPNFMAIKACATLQENINDFIQNIFPEYQVSLQASKKGCEFFYTVDKTIIQTDKKNNALINTKMSSGSEKAILSVAFKIALARIYGCDCIFLDEIDFSCDDDNSQMLFQGIIDEGFNQVTVITHKENTKEFLINNYDTKLYEIEKGRLI